MRKPLLTVVETPAYLSRAKSIFTDAEREMVVNLLAADPTCGNLLVDGGGIRKVRVGVGGRGKSGGARVVYFFADADRPVILLWAFAKKDQADLTDAQRRALAAVAKTLVGPSKAGGT